MTDMTIKEFREMPEVMRKYAYDIMLKQFIFEQANFFKRPAFYRDAVYDRKKGKSVGAYTLSVK